MRVRERGSPRRRSARADDPCARAPSAQATQTLERAFGEINDALEELRYEFEEVRRRRVERWINL